MEAKASTFFFGFKQIQSYIHSIIKNINNMTKVFRGEPYNELYKVNNFPKGNLQNEEVKNVLTKILFDAYAVDTEELEESDMFFDDEFWINEVNTYLNNLSSFETVYIHTDGEGRLSIYDSLNYFSERYRTEEQWSVREWIEI